MQVRSISLGRLILLITLVFLLVTIGVIYFTSSYIREQAIKELAEDDARKTSELIFQSLYSAMRKGWDKEEIGEIIDRLNRAQPDVRIRVLRGEPVIEQYGEIEGEKAIREGDPVLRKALFQGRESLVRWNEDHLRYVYPVEVKEECLGCHDAASVGDINGVVDVIYPITKIKVSLDFIMNMVVVYLTVVMVLMVIALQSSLRSLLVRPISRVTGVTQNLISHLDLSQRVSSGTFITEIRSLVGYFNKLLSTMQSYSRRLEELGTKDPLTGLYNRRKFEEFIQHEVERSYRYNEPFSLLMLDLDNFKHVNDTFGHPIGDLVLKQFAKLLRGQLRRTDVCARFGGDEFGILLAETPGAQAAEVAEKLRATVADTPFDLPVGEIRTTVSIGRITFPETVPQKDKLSGAMDVAMYKAKRSGKNRVMSLDSGEHDAATEVFNTGQSVRRALDEDRIEAYLQPIRDVATGEDFGYEVLARIVDGDGVVNAADFMRCAEELGLAEEIDIRVFERGLAALQDEALAGRTLFFNLASATFCNIERMRNIPARLAHLGIAPQQVVFEITEREALPHISELSALINELREQGIAFALDDFGSGFSSFMYLKFLAVDFIKIEGAFVRHMVHDGRDRIMVEHIRSLAQRFGIRTVAEHVEDEEVDAVLRELGVEYGQGFHYGVPKPFRQD